jgi:hypothetical protein
LTISKDKKRKMAKQMISHRRALEIIAANPGRFGIEHVISASIEQTLYHNGRGILAQPDVVFETSKNEIIIIEYKSSGEHEERAAKQLKNAIWWFGAYRPEILPNNIKTLIITGTDPEYKEKLY